MTDDGEQWPADRVDDLVAAQAARTPDAVAVVCGGHTLTYASLQRDCERAAAGLRALGIGRGSLVGIHLERSIEMLVAVLAVMRAGGAYVPLEPGFPPQRLAHMVADAGLSLVITDPALADGRPPGDYRRVDVQALLDSAHGEPTSPAPEEALDTADLMYVLYTSGSTGMPKGVALEHRNVANLLLSMRDAPGLTATDRLLAVTTLSFDIAALELFLPLISGATVVIATRDEASDGQRLLELIDHHGVTVMQATPATWRLLVDAGWSGSRSFKALCGGETLPRELAQALLQRCDELWNLYGPTETAIWSTVFRVVDADAPVLIGRPIANTRIYVLDKGGHPSPTGVPGEICIAGAGVARGYLNRPELTAERFVRDPFSTAFSGRMYRTGDSGRFLADGNLEFRNRLDGQIKIRGFRVELGEIEAALASYPAVAQAAAKAFELRPGDMRLVGYAVPANGQDLDEADLRAHLSQRLPRYMIPQHLVSLATMPALPNGKTDRNALPAPQFDANDSPPPADTELTAQERTVLELCRTLIGSDRIMLDDGFFEAGGHSLLAGQFVSRLEKQTGVRISILRVASCSLRDLARELPAPDRAASPAQPALGARLTRWAQATFTRTRQSGADN